MTSNDRLQARVRALLAKAESTEYPEEAAALTAKAQELISLHAIDVALLETRTQRGQVGTRLIEVPSSYVKEKFILLGGIARANSCRAILGVERETLERMINDRSLFAHKGRFASVVGYESDLDAVEMLFTSLLVQAVNEVLRHGSQVTEWGENRTQSFRRSFLYQFAWTVRERLAEVTDLARADASEARGDSVLPVLVHREEEVLSVVQQRFRATSTVRSSASNVDGVHAGRAAGQRADIGSTRFRGHQPTLSR